MESHSRSRKSPMKAKPMAGPQDKNLPPETPARQLPPAAQRALNEAAARRAAAGEGTAPREQGGRGGLDPARYGDWEIKGIACDF